MPSFYFFFIRLAFITASSPYRSRILLMAASSLRRFSSTGGGGSKSKIDNCSGSPASTS